MGYPPYFLWVLHLDSAVFNLIFYESRWIGPQENGAPWGISPEISGGQPEPLFLEISWSTQSTTHGATLGLYVPDLSVSTGERCVPAPGVQG